MSASGTTVGSTAAGGEATAANLMIQSQRSIIFGPLPPPYGGVTTFMSTLAEEAVRRRVSVWSYTGDTSKFAGQVKYVDHRRLGHLPSMFQQGRGARIVDSTHFHLEYPNPLLLPAWVAARSLLRFHWIKVLHDGSLPSRFQEFSSVRRTLFRLALRSIDEIVAVDEELGRWLVDDAGYGGKVHVIPALLPAAHDVGTKTGAKTADALDKYNTYHRRVCSVGAFISSYGFLDVARAVEVIRSETDENIGLLLADAGFARDDAYREQVLRGRPWIVVAEQLPQADMKHLYLSSHVFVRAFEHESFGLSRIEALLAGIPVIATNVGETRGMLTYDFGDVDGICSHLRRVFKGESLSDVEHWAAVFESEARENLRRYWQVISPDQAVDRNEA